MPKSNFHELSIEQSNITFIVVGSWLNKVIMSFQYSGVTVDKLKKLWPTIVSNLSFKLDNHSSTSLGQENAVDVANLQAIIRICCDHKPVNFDEYISYAMIATFMELLKSPSTQFHLQSTQLMAHTFNTNTNQWYRDEKKVKQIITHTHISIFCCCLFYRLNSYIKFCYYKGYGSS